MSGEERDGGITKSWSPASSLNFFRVHPPPSCHKMPSISRPSSIAGLLLTLLLLLVPLVPAQGEWQRFAPIGQGAIYENGVASVGTDVYIVGGISFDTNNTVQSVNTVQVYDTVANAWTLANGLPLPINHPNVASVDGRLYVLGGILGSFMATASSWPAVANAWSYDPWNDTWTALADLPGPKASAAVGVYNSSVYLAGGMTYQAVTVADALTSVWSYDTASDAWRTDYPDLPEGRQHVGGAVVGHTLYVVGGRTLNRTLVRDTVFALDLDDVGAGWQTRSPLPTARGGLACAALDGRIYCAGGENPDLGGYGVYEQTEAYDVATDTWEELAPMALPRHGTGAAAVGGKVYIPGGGVITATNPVRILDAFVP